jgi:LCP family protein required for cell wall assembly
MNDEIEQAMRNYFATLEDDAPAARPMPAAPPVTPTIRPHRVVRVVLAAAAIAALVVGVIAVRSRTMPSPRTSVETVPSAPVVSTATASTSSVAATQSPVTFPAADPAAQNYLVVGEDNNACADPGSDTAGGIGDRTALGERSDTIMIVRVGTQVGQVAILSFPRDLWVKVDGTNTSSRINSVHVHNDPQPLINTLYINFGIPVNHYVQIDFCAFKHIVDAVDGVSVPFPEPVRDLHTGLAVPVAGCRNLDGDEALAYVRSRHLESLGSDGVWHADPTSDLGRIERQQDFMWRTLLSATAHGLSDPGTAAELYRTVISDVVTDAGFTLDTALQLAGALDKVQPEQIEHMQIAGTPTVVAGSAVLIPDMTDAATQAALAIFRGHDAPWPSASVSVSSSVPPTSASPAVVPDPTATC